MAEDGKSDGGTDEQTGRTDNAKPIVDYNKHPLQDFNSEYH